jgi:CubicO group peptidase (beta-lactamase class C family)
MTTCAAAAARSNARREDDPFRRVHDDSDPGETTMPTPASPRPIGLFDVLLLAACLSGCAGSMPAAQAPEGPDSSQDAPRISAFRQQVEADRERLKIPGLSAVVLEDGKVLWTEGLGYADVEHQVPATPDTLYHVASLTKTFSAILVLQLVEQGKLDLDEPASHYSSDFKDDTVRLKHLLSHTSEGTPGDHYKYNPDAFEYLKAVLEKVTGKPLRQLFVETLLDPLACRTACPAPTSSTIRPSGRSSARTTSRATGRT